MTHKSCFSSSNPKNLTRLAAHDWAVFSPTDQAESEFLLEVFVGSSCFLNHHQLLFSSAFITFVVFCFFCVFKQTTWYFSNNQKSRYVDFCCSVLPLREQQAEEVTAAETDSS